MDLFQMKIPWIMNKNLEMEKIPPNTTNTTTAEEELVLVNLFKF